MNERGHEHDESMGGLPAASSASVPDAADPTAATSSEPDSIGELAGTGPAEGDREPGGLPVSLAPVAPGRPGAARWGIALLVTALVVGVAAAAVFLVSAGTRVSRLAGYVPADTPIYLELRADLPGDQRKNLGDVLGYLPGFDDRSNVEGKIDEALDQLVGQVSNSEHDYSVEVKPWLGGEIVIAMPELTTSTDPSRSRILWLTSVKDAPAARGWLAKHITDVGPTKSESYQGVELTVGGTGGLGFAYGVGDGVIFAGDLTSVKAAIDTRGASAFGSSQSLAEAQRATPGDHLGFVYLDMKRFMAVATSPDLPGAVQLPADLLAQVPPWAAFSFRVESDALVAELAMPNTYEPGQVPAAKVSTLATRLPGGTLMELEFRSLGQSIKNAIEQYKKIPQYAEAVGQVEQALTVLGGVDALTGWMGDATIVVARDGDTVSGGLVIETSDEKATGDRFVQLRNLLTLAGAGSDITIRDEPYGDGQITIVDLGNLADLAALSGQELPAPAEGRVEIAYTVQQGLAIVGVGDGFVKSILDTTQASSLAGQEQYKATLERAGKTNSSQMYVDLTGVREFVERLLPADQRGTYERDVKPYVEPFAAAGAGGTTTNERLTGRFIILLK